MSPRHAATGGRGSLLRVEVSRLAARRLVQLLLLAGVLGLLAFMALSLVEFARPDADALAAATESREADLAAARDYLEQCLADPTIAEEEKEFICGTEPVEEDFRLEYYLDVQPFLLAEDLPTLAVPVAAATAMLTFLVAATYVGAEWSSRNMVALLFWEPRRWRVIGVKTAVAGLFGAVLGLLALLAWIGWARVLAATRGSSAGLPAGFWGDVAGLAGRSALLGMLTALIGFAVANLIRNTGAALGVGFAYFALAESALRGLLPRSSPYLVTDSALALIVPGGLTQYVPGPDIDEFGNPQYVELLITNLRGGLTLAIYAAVLVALSSWLFRRRDLQ